MGEVLGGGQHAFAVLLVVAATAKFMRREDFSGALRLSGLPSGWVRGFSAGVPAVEIALAMTLLSATDRRSLGLAFGAVALLLTCFSAWIAVVLRLGSVRRCACFGGGQGNLSSRTLFRNALLVGAAGACSAACFTTHPEIAQLPPLYGLGVVATTAVVTAIVKTLPMITLSSTRPNPNGGTN